MGAYADTSFLVAAYLPEADSTRVLEWLQRARAPLPFTPLHRHELRTAIRLRVFRGEITGEQRQQAFQDIESDLADGIVVHTIIPWTEAFREAELLAMAHGEKLGVRSLNLLHVGIALALKSAEFLTLDGRQASLAKAAGLKVRF